MKTTHTVTDYQQQVQAAVEKYCENVTPAAKGSQYIRRVQQNTGRLQGSLVLLGYEICGGEDAKMIERAALAIELFHAYVQCLDEEVDVTQALRGQHEAAIIMATLEADPEYRIKALGITNRTLMLASLARLKSTSEEDRLHWQATELTLNPIHVGQVLAGSDCDANNAVTPVALRFGNRIARTRMNTLNYQQQELFFSEIRKSCENLIHI